MQVALCMLLWALLASYQVVLAQTCDESLTPQDGELGYSDRGGFCEGLYIVPVSTHVVPASIRVMGYQFTGSLIHDAVESLQVALLATTSSPLLLRGVPNYERPHYRLDASITSNDPFHWDATLARRTHVFPSKMRFLAYASTDSGTVLYPVEVGDDGSGDSHPPAIFMRSTEDLSAFEFRFGSIADPPGSWTLVEGPFFRGHEFSLEVKAVSEPQILEIRAFTLGIERVLPLLVLNLVPPGP